MGMRSPSFSGRAPDLGLPERQIMDAATREVAEYPEHRQHRRLDEDVEPDLRSEIRALLETRGDRSLEHVFTLLSLALDRDAIILSCARPQQQREPSRHRAEASAQYPARSSA